MPDPVVMSLRDFVRGGYQEMREHPDRPVIVLQGSTSIEFVAYPGFSAIKLVVPTIEAEVEVEGEVVSVPPGRVPRKAVDLTKRA